MKSPITWMLCGGLALVVVGAGMAMAAGGVPLYDYPIALGAVLILIGVISATA